MCVNTLPFLPFSLYPCFNIWSTNSKYCVSGCFILDILRKVNIIFRNGVNSLNFLCILYYVQNGKEEIGGVGLTGVKTLASKEGRSNVKELAKKTEKKVQEGDLASAYEEGTSTVGAKTMIQELEEGGLTGLSSISR